MHGGLLTCSVALSSSTFSYWKGPALAACLQLSSFCLCPECGDCRAACSRPVRFSAQACSIAQQPVLDFLLWVGISGDADVSERIFSTGLTYCMQILSTSRPPYFHFKHLIHESSPVQNVLRLSCRMFVQWVPIDLAPPAFIRDSLSIRN